MSDDRLQPIDLETAKLPKSLGGYDRKTVDELLQRAAKEIATLRQELKICSEDMGLLRMEVVTFREQESILKDAILVAQRAAEEVRTQARNEAEVVLADARHQAAALQKELQSRLNDLRFDIERLALEKQRFVATFRAMLEEYLSRIVELQMPVNAIVDHVGDTNGESDRGGAFSQSASEPHGSF
jgi:cell division initiation protein